MPASHSLMPISDAATASALDTAADRMAGRRARLATANRTAARRSADAEAVMGGCGKGSCDAWKACAALSSATATSRSSGGKTRGLPPEARGPAAALASGLT